MRMFDRGQFRNGLVKYINRTLPAQETMPDSVCERLMDFLRSDSPQSGAGLLDEMYLEFCPEYERGESLWDLSRYGDDCDDEDRTILKETAVAFGRYFSEGENVAENNGERLRRIYLHRHQSEALNAYRNGENILVCTGTGSGKTECFLIPIIDKLLRERKRQTLEDYNDKAHRHVHAMIMYPMNALVNDQVRRLRQIVSYVDFTGDLNGKAITFGQYTGDLKSGKELDDDIVRALGVCAGIQSPQDVGVPNTVTDMDKARPIASEYVNRQEWSEKGPADIMVTNYSMMEQMLIRPDRDQIFKGGSWDFVVLDEAHSYSGSTGTEIAWQMRRLERRIRGFVGENDYHLPTYIATSATLVNGNEETQREAGVSFMRDLFPIGENGNVFVGLDHFTSLDVDMAHGKVVTNQFTADIESLVENTADWEEAVKANKARVEISDYVQTVQNAGGSVTVADALWLAGNDILAGANLTVRLEQNGWIEYFARLVSVFSASLGEDAARYNFWRRTLHDYDDHAFSRVDGRFYGNRLHYLNNWKNIHEQGQGINGANSITGDEFKYLIDAVGVVQDYMRQVGKAVAVNVLSALVHVEVDYSADDDSQSLQQRACQLCDQWNQTLNLGLTNDDFSSELRCKDVLARYLIARNDITLLRSRLMERRVGRLADFAQQVGGSEHLLRMLQISGLAKLAASRKPLIDVKCHQSFRGVSGVGVWFDEGGDYHFIRSEAEYTEGDEETRRKIFSLGICRECGQLYLLGYTPARAVQQIGDVLWRQPVGSVRYLHAIAFPWCVGDVVPYDNNKIIADDDRDLPMGKLEPHVPAGDSPWRPWLHKGVEAICGYSIDLKAGKVTPGFGENANHVYWCLDAKDFGADEGEYIPRCACCRTIQDRRGNARYGIITPYEAQSDQYIVASLGAFAKATVRAGNESAAKVLAFSDSRQAASSLALNFETGVFRSFAETALRVAVGKYNLAREDPASELGQAIRVVAHQERIDDIDRQLVELTKHLDAAGIAKMQRLNDKKQQLLQDQEICPLTVNNLVRWQLMSQGTVMPGVFDIDYIEANGLHRPMTEQEAQAFVVLSVLVDPSSRSRAGVWARSRILDEQTIPDNIDGVGAIDSVVLRRCLQRIYRQALKKYVVEGSGNDYELKDGNVVFRANAAYNTPPQGYEQFASFQGREYVKDAVLRFFPNLNGDALECLLRYIWNAFCDNGILASLEGFDGYYKLNYDQICHDAIIELSPGAAAAESIDYPFSIQEHTAQISGLRGAFFQKRFASGAINVLSCSTTFEMGIDVGGLNNVFLANLPPTTANYKQRAGRAGRRPGALAQIVTFVRNGDWSRDTLLSMFNGTVTPPKIYLESPVYKYRHLRAEALRFFLGFVNEISPTRPKNGKLVPLKWSHFGSFLMGFRYTWQQPQGGRRLYIREDTSRIEHSIVEQCVSRWLDVNTKSDHKARLCDEYIASIRDINRGAQGLDFKVAENSPSRDLIFQLVGDNLVSGFGNEAEQWTNGMIRLDRDYYIKRGGCYMPVDEANGGANGFAFRWPGKNDPMRLPLRDRKLLLMRRMANISDQDVVDGNWMSTDIKDYMGNDCPPLQRRLLDENTISALSSCGIIPKYGFPIDVIELLTDGYSARDVDLKRDMKIGLFEYAPGQVIVANKHEYDVLEGGQGVLFNTFSFTNQVAGADGNGLVGWYCAGCKCISEEPQDHCPDCHGVMQRVALVRPDAFKAKDMGHRHRFVRKVPKGLRVVRLSQAVEGDSFRLPNIRMEVMFDANRTISYYNINSGLGFNLSGTPAAENDLLRNAFLTHNVHTDIAIWKLDPLLFTFQGPLACLLPQNNCQGLLGLTYGAARFRNAMHSALVAVRKAATRVLRLQENEIDAFLYPNGAGYWWVIYDAAQGGGGNVLSLAKNRQDDPVVDATIREVVRVAISILECECRCGVQPDLLAPEVVGRIPIPISVYSSLADNGLNAAGFYRVAKSCGRCIAPRYSSRKDEVFDNIDAALVLNAILTPAEKAAAIPPGFHERMDGETVGLEKRYITNDGVTHLRDDMNDGLDLDSVIAIED